MGLERRNNGIGCRSFPPFSDITSLWIYALFLSPDLFLFWDWRERILWACVDPVAVVEIQKTKAALRRAGKLKWIALRYRNENNQKFSYVNDP